MAIERRTVDLLRIARAAVDWLQRFATPLYAGVVAVFLLLFLAAAKLLTVEADEAWNLLSTMHAFGISLPPTDAILSPVLTSGGVHFLIHGLLARITDSMFAHRLVSLVFAIALLATAYRALRQMDRPKPVALAGTALFAAVPGFLFQAGLATAEIIATYFTILGCLYWARRGQSSNLAALLSGLLFGLACATRVNCVVVLPAILIYALLAGDVSLTRLGRVLLTIGTAGATMLLAIAVYFIAAQASSGSEVGHFFLGATGVTAPKSPTHVVWAFVISDRVMPIWLIAAIGAAYVVSTSEGGDGATGAQSSKVSALLLLVGLAGLAAWIAKAPIPHVRYLWPAVPCLWLAGIIQLTQPAITAQRGLRALPFHLLILAACGARIAADSLSLANGESLTLVYQANGMSPLQLPNGSFHAARDQRALAAFVASQASDARFYGLIPANSYPLTLLGRRAIPPVQTMGSAGPRFLIVNPADVSVWHPDAAFVQWMRASTTPAFVSGDFAAFRVKDSAQPPPPPGMIRVGDNDLLRPAAG